MKIAIGNNHRGYRNKMELAKALEALGHEVENFGCNDSAMMDYPDVALPVAEAVGSGRCERGILIGGNGMGMCMVANKVQGVRAAAVHDEYSAQLTRERHDCNVLCLAADSVSVAQMLRIVEVFLSTAFSGARYARMLDKMMQIEQDVSRRPVHR